MQRHFSLANYHWSETILKNVEININKHITVDVGGVTLNDQAVVIVQLHEGYVVSIRFYKASTLNDRNGRFFQFDSVDKPRYIRFRETIGFTDKSGGCSSTCFHVFWILLPVWLGFHSDNKTSKTSEYLVSQ